MCARHSPRRSSRKPREIEAVVANAFQREKECRMPLIKPRTRGKQILRHIVRLDRENTETLHAYAAFLGESTDYVLNQVIDTVLAKDKEFAQWRAEHGHSHVPHAVSAVRRNRRTSGHKPPVPTVGAGVPTDSMRVS
jgi:hypothetical protein